MTCVDEDDNADSEDDNTAAAAVVDDDAAVVVVGVGVLVLVVIALFVAAFTFSITDEAVGRDSCVARAAAVLLSCVCAVLVLLDVDARECDDDSVSLFFTLSMGCMLGTCMSASGMSTRLVRKCCLSSVCMQSGGGT